MLSYPPGRFAKANLGGELKDTPGVNPGRLILSFKVARPFNPGREALKKRGFSVGKYNPPFWFVNPPEKNFKKTLDKTGNICYI